MTRTDEPFLAAARTCVDLGADQRWGSPPKASVRWRLRDPRTVRVTQVTGDSAGLAFAVALRQISSARPWRTALDPATSYLGSTDRDGRVLTPASTPPLLPDEASRRLRYLITPPHWTGSGPSAAAQSPVNLKLRPAADADRAVALGRRPVRARRARILASAGAALLLVAGAVTAVIQSRHSASTQDTIATARERSAAALALANQARTQLASDPPRAIVAAAAAYRLDPADPVVQDAVIAAAAADPRARGYLSPSAPVTHLAMSADGTLVAALLTNGKLEAWRLSPNSPPRPLRVPPVPGIVRTIGFLGATHSLIAAGATLTLADLTHYTTRLLARPPDASLRRNHNPGRHPLRRHLRHFFPCGHPALDRPPRREPAASYPPSRPPPSPSPPTARPSWPDNPRAPSASFQPPRSAGPARPGRPVRPA